MRENILIIGGVIVVFIGLMIAFFNEGLVGLVGMIISILGLSIITLGAIVFGLYPKKEKL